MAQAKTGDTVRVHYNGLLEDGTIFGSSRGDKPVEFTIGENKMIKGLEQAVVGMKEGDTKTVTIPPEDGFGPYSEKLTTTISKSGLPSHIEPKVGKVLVFREDEGKNVTATIKDIHKNGLTLDANHPLAGKELTLEIELLELAK